MMIWKMEGDEMSNFRILTTEELIKELEKHKFKQLHAHHTWKPTHKNFNGKNHIQLQENMKNHHVKANEWSDIGQHLTLMPDGSWVTGRPFDKTPASISGWNTGALAVEMLGNFDKLGELPFNNLGYDKLEGKQKESMLKLMNYFGEKYGYDNIKFHKEGPGVFKSCPGTSLNKEIMIQEAKAMSEKKEAKEKPHWGEKVYESLEKKGLKLNEKRFDDTITRAEAFVIADMITDWVIEKIKGVK